MASDDGGRKGSGGALLWHRQDPSGYVEQPGQRRPPGEVVPSCACGYSHGRAVPLAEARRIMKEHRRGGCMYVRPEAETVEREASDFEPVTTPTTIRTKRSPSEEQEERLLDLVRAGSSARAASREVGVSIRTGTRLVRQARERGVL